MSTSTRSTSTRFVTRKQHCKRKQDVSKIEWKAILIEKKDNKIAFQMKSNNSDNSEN